MKRRLTGPVSYLVMRRFPLLHEVRSGLVVLPADEKRALVDAAQAYTAELEQHPPEDLEARVDEEQHKAVLEAQFGKHFLDRECFFAWPLADADFEHWAKMAYWSRYEGVVLLCGMDPRVVTLASMGRVSKDSPFARRLVELAELASRAGRAYELSEQNRPAEFLAWAKGRDLPHPSELETAVEKYAGTVVDWRARCRQLAEELEQARSAKPQDLKTRERETALKIILALAVHGLGYDPTAARSDVPKAIEDELAALGLSLTDDTARTWLKEAAALVATEVWQERYRKPNSGVG